MRIPSTNREASQQRTQTIRAICMSIINDAFHVDSKLLTTNERSLSRWLWKIRFFLSCGGRILFTIRLSYLETDVRAAGADAETLFIRVGKQNLGASSPYSSTGHDDAGERVDGACFALLACTNTRVAAGHL